MKKPNGGGLRPGFRSALFAMISVTALCLVGCRTIQHEAHHHSHPEVSVPDGHVHAFRVNAKGVQIYEWSGTNWVFVAPEARLFKEDQSVMGKHYKGTDGPAWEATDGSKVVGQVVTKADAYNSNSIPHLLLKAVSTSKSGTFANITYIQRVDTEGGLAPIKPGTKVGETARVTYCAVYAFYRKAK